jgi:hypothetical protein
MIWIWPVSMASMSAPQVRAVCWLLAVQGQTSVVHSPLPALFFDGSIGKLRYGKRKGAFGWVGSSQGRNTPFYALHLKNNENKTLPALNRPSIYA